MHRQKFLRSAYSLPFKLFAKPIQILFVGYDLIARYMYFLFLYCALVEHNVFIYYFTRIRNFRKSYICRQNLVHTAIELEPDVMTVTSM